MNVTYKCKCMKTEETIAVPDRRPNSALEDWFPMVQLCVSVDHRALSPLCMTKEMEYMKMPHAEGKQIGEPGMKQ